MEKIDSSTFVSTNNFDFKDPNTDFFFCFCRQNTDYIHIYTYLSKVILRKDKNKRGIFVKSSKGAGKSFVLESPAPLRCRAPLSLLCVFFGNPKTYEESLTVEIEALLALLYEFSPLHPS